MKNYKKSYLNEMLLILLMMISTGSFSKEKGDELDLYDLGSELSRCAGDYEFASMVHKVVIKDNAMAKLLHEHANGWQTAGMANYYFSGLTREASQVSAESGKETKITQWLSELESLEKGNTEEFLTLTGAMWEKIGQCNTWDAVVVDSRKRLKKAWLSRPKVEDF
ncbi:hypothetical protein HN615_14710 [Candidatus Woesearchaeota archaeon]|jgi:hypothetical protein|nr:hypothetical protein [Candidatus Woesearchaeota archaeon]